MSRFIFYLRYGLRNLSRGGRWTTLAIFSIAAGVATIVALRSLGLAIGDSLVENVRVENRGDILLSKGGPTGVFSFGLTLERNPQRFSDSEVERVREYVEARGGKIAAFAVGSNAQVTPLEEDRAGRPQFISSYFIDPQTYPPTHEILALDPQGAPLSELFAGNAVVISENLARDRGLKVGDAVRVSGTEEIYTVGGIVATQHEAGLRNLFGAFFGFVYFDIANARAVIDAEIAPNQIAIAFSEPLDAETLDRAVREVIPIATVSPPPPAPTTYLDILERNEQVSVLIGDFIVVMGLGALLIGGVGIMNTMLVMVRRRTNEIAALKTFGLKGRQVAALFFVEGGLLGLIGSLIGCGLGILLSGAVNQYGEAFLQQSLRWRIYPEALLYGFGLGMTVTVIFGVAPILTALQVRPGIILRPNETHIPTMGILQYLLSMIVVTVAIGLIVGQIISPSFALAQEAQGRFVIPSPYLVGIIGVAAALLLLGVLVMILWVVVWLVGRLPAFGSVDLRLALRNLSTHRLRTATTLLALSAGMFALSSITFVSQGTRELLNVQLINQLGGNVLVFPLPFVPNQLAQVALDRAMGDMEGITYRTTITNVRAEPVAIDGRRINPRDETARLFLGRWRNHVVIESDNPNLAFYDSIVAGRGLTAEDYGKPVVVGSAEAARQLGISVGSVLTYNLNGNEVDFEVVGLTDQETEASTNFIGSVVPPGVTGEGSQRFQVYTYMVEPEHLNEVLLRLSNILVVIAVDVAFIDSLIGRLIDQFAAVPTIVALLSLAAAAVIMANTVALSTLERRRQIGILKSIGLKSKRVLLIMLIETTIVGLLSALLGLGLSSLFVAFYTNSGGVPIPLPQDSRIIAVLLVIAAVGIGWLATFLNASVALRERVMNVLRYE